MKVKNKQPLYQPGDVVVYHDHNIRVYRGALAHEFIRIEIEGRIGYESKDELSDTLKTQGDHKSRHNAKHETERESMASSVADLYETFNHEIEDE